MAEDPKIIPSPAANAGGGAGRPPAPAVASASPAAPDRNPSPHAPGAKIGAIGYTFRFPVESVEGQNERREHERLRKASRRDAAKAVAAKLDAPPPLPPVTTALPGQPQAPAGPQSSDVPGPALTPGDEPPAIPWRPELLTDLVSELLDAAEEGRVGQFVAKCEEAGITGKLLKEIEADSRFPKLAKIMLKRSLPKLAAKWLNRSGVSAEYQDELEVVTALLLMVQNDRKNSAKLDELIEQRRQAAKRAEQQTPPAPAVMPDPAPFGPQPFTC